MDGRNPQLGRGEGRKRGGAGSEIAAEGSPRLLFDPPLGRARTTLIRRLLCRLPELSGEPIRVRFGLGLSVSGRRLVAGRGVGQPVHAGSFLRKRVIVLDTALLANRSELRRILSHELFHFVWFRLGNPRRRSYEALLETELGRGARGELGWSAQWRKQALRCSDRRNRTRRWREYVCESFCDSGAWLTVGVRRSDEWTLAQSFRQARRKWFRAAVWRQRISV